MKATAHWRLCILTISLLFLLLSLSCPALAVPGDVSISAPLSNPAPNTTFTVSITIETSPTTALGGYDLTVNYDSAVVNIVTIAGGSSPQFTAAPTSNPATYSSGSTDFLATNSTTLTAPTGAVQVANITFKAVGAAGQHSTLTLINNGIIDTYGLAITPTNIINSAVTISAGSGPPTGANIYMVLFLAAVGLLSGLKLLTAKLGISPYQVRFGLGKKIDLKPAVSVLVPGAIVLIIFVIILSAITGAQAAVLNGDANGDGILNLSDAGLIKGYLAGTVTHIPSRIGADANGDGRVDISDVFLVEAKSNGLISDGLEANIIESSWDSLAGLATISGLNGASQAPINLIQATDLSSGATTSTIPLPNGSFSLQLPSAPGRSIRVVGIGGSLRTRGFIMYVPKYTKTAINRTGPPERPMSDIAGVIPYSGEFADSVIDLSLKGIGLNFTLTRTYKSQIDYNGPLGHNWDHIYNKRLIKDSTTTAGFNIIRQNGRGRSDIYSAGGGGSYTSPPGFFNRLNEESNGTFVLQYPGGAREIYKGFDGSASEGCLLQITDRRYRELRFDYNDRGNLIRVYDSLGRRIDFAYDIYDRIISVTDFTGRSFAYSYDSNGDLVTVTGPPVTGTPNGNDFPAGKTTKYSYSSGFGNQERNHNLLTVTRPNEAAVAGPPYVINTYSIADKVSAQSIGGTNASGISAGGTSTLSYGSLETTVTDPNGNVTQYNFDASGMTNRIERFTRGLRPAEPASYVSTLSYDSEGRLLSRTLPEGNSIEYTYDSAAVNRLHQRNLLQRRVLPGPRPASQTQLITTYEYEPVYNLVRRVTNSTGDITQERFDYQEGADTNAIANAMGVSSAAASTELTAAGVSLGQGDINQDGSTAQTMGNVVESSLPTVNLQPGSSLIPVEGDTTQEIISNYTYNDLGQLSKVIDPEGNDTIFLRNSFNDPDGDGSPTPAGAKWLRLLINADSANGGGWVSQAKADADSTSPRRREAAAPVQAITQYEYDNVGNITRLTDPLGHAYNYTFNALDQVVREIAPAPFLYYTDFNYDANNDLTAVAKENVTINDAGDSVDVVANPELNTSLSRDILGNIVTKNNEISAGEVGPPANAITNYRYDANSNLQRVTLPEGNEVYKIYDERDLLFKQTDGYGSADASTRTIAYDKNGNTVTITDAADNNGDGLSESYDNIFDGFDRLVRTIDPAGGKAESDYDALGRVIEERFFGQPFGSTPKNNSGAGNLLLRQTLFSYDELGRRYEDRATVFDTPGGPPTANSPLTTNYDYDRSNRLVRTIAPDNSGALQTVNNEYDGLDRLIDTTDSLTNEVSREYDAASRLIRRVEIDKAAGLPDTGFTTEYVYDELGRMIRNTDNIGNTSRVRYDSRDNPILKSDANGPQIPDPSGDFPFATTPGGVTMINDNGNTIKYTVDGLGRYVKEEEYLRVGGVGDGNLDPAGSLDLTNPDNPDGVITYNWDFDKNGRLISEKDDEGKTTTYQYDSLGRPVTKINDDLTTVLREYDKDSNLVRLTDENNTIVDGVYDALDRVTTETAAVTLSHLGGSTLKTFEYDGLSRPTKLSDNNEPLDPNDDSVNTFQYDSLGRGLKDFQLDGVSGTKTVESAYNPNGNRGTLNYAGGRVITKNFNSVNQPMQVIDGAQTYNYEYRGGNNVIAGISPVYSLNPVINKTYPNGLRLTTKNNAGNADIGHDGDGRVTQLRTLDTSDTLRLGHLYNYGRGGTESWQKRMHGDQLADIRSYDSAYRLTENARDAVDETNPATAAFTDSYTLDGVGNRTQSTEDLVSRFYTHDQKNQYDFVSPDAYTLDLKSNIISDGYNSFLYDYQDRVIEINNLGDYIINKYDARGRRVSKETSAGKVNFVYDGPRLLEERDASDTVTAEYVYGATGELLAMERSGNTFYYNYNRRGDVTALTDVAGNIVEGYRYSAFGAPTIACDPGLDTVWFTNDDVTVPNSPLGNRFLFAGMEYDDEAGLYFSLDGYFDPKTGRWISLEKKSPGVKGSEGKLNIPPGSRRAYTFANRDSESNLFNIQPILPPTTLKNLNVSPTMPGSKLIIGVKEATFGNRPDYKEYGFGSHEYGDIDYLADQLSLPFQLKFSLNNSSELFATSGGDKTYHSLDTSSKKARMYTGDIGYDPVTVEGWYPDNNSTGMRKEVFDWVNQWGFGQTPALSGAISRAQNILKMEAAGNSNSSNPHYPSSYKSILSVAANDNLSNGVLSLPFFPYLDDDEPIDDLGCGIHVAGAVNRKVFSQNFVLGVDFGLGIRPLDKSPVLLNSGHGSFEETINGFAACPEMFSSSNGKWKGWDLDGTGSGIAVEEMELAVEEIIRAK